MVWWLGAVGSLFGRLRAGSPGTPGWRGRRTGGLRLGAGRCGSTRPSEDSRPAHHERGGWGRLGARRTPHRFRPKTAEPASPLGEGEERGGLHLIASERGWVGPGGCAEDGRVRDRAPTQARTAARAWCWRGVVGRGSTGDSGPVPLGAAEGRLFDKLRTGSPRTECEQNMGGVEAWCRCEELSWVMG